MTVRHNGFVECTISTGKTTVIEVEDFDGNVTEMIYEAGKPFGTLPQVEIPEGYEFVGWKDQDGNTVTAETIVQEGMRLIPEFSEEKTDEEEPGGTEDPDTPKDPDDTKDPAGQGTVGGSDNSGRTPDGTDSGCDTAVDTGDPASVTGIIALMITALAVFGVTVVQRKKAK